MPVPCVRVVVLNYNGHPHVHDAITSILASDWPADRLQLVVVDNCSTDGSDDDIQTRFPDVDLRRTSRNTGFPANNIALDDLDNVDYVALINNDATVEPGWLGPLVDALEADPGLGAACARVMFASRFASVTLESTSEPSENDRRATGVRLSGARMGDDDIWRGMHMSRGFWNREFDRLDGTEFAWTKGHAELFVPQSLKTCLATGTVSLRLSSKTRREVVLRSGTQMSTVVVSTSPQWISISLAGEAFDVINNAGNDLVDGGHGADRGFLAVDGDEFDKPCEVFAWCGNGVLLRPAYLAEVGLFDESFFAYYEDFDLAWRGRSRGWKYAYVPGSVVRHLHATTSIAGSDFFLHHVERNHLLTLVKNAPLSQVFNGLHQHGNRTSKVALREVVRPLLRGETPNSDHLARRTRITRDFALAVPGAVRERRRNRRERSVSYNTIQQWSRPRDAT